MVYDLLLICKQPQILLYWGSSWGNEHVIFNFTKKNIYAAILYDELFDRPKYNVRKERTKIGKMNKRTQAKYLNVVHPPHHI